MKVLLSLVFFMMSWSVMAGKISAGIAKVSITPVVDVDKVNTLQAGAKTVTKISDPLYAKVLILSDDVSNIAFISLDLMYLPSLAFNDILAALRKQYSLDQIFLSITHTHSGYVGNNDYTQLKEKIISTVNAAKANLQPIKIGVNQGQLDESYNRIVRQKNFSAKMLWTNPERIPNRDVDQSVGVINIKTLNGKTLVNLVNYSAHPVVTMDLNDVVISADYPGQLAKYLRLSGEGETLFFLGAAGDVNPYHADTKPTALSLEKSSELGNKLAFQVIEHIKAIKSYQQQGSFKFQNLPYTLPVVGVQASSNEVKTISGEVNTLILTDDISLASFSGEFFNQFGVMLKQKSPTKHTFFLGYTNGSLGYIPTQAAIKFGGYGAESKDLWFDVSLGDKQINDAIKSLNTLNDASASDN